MDHNQEPYSTAGTEDPACDLHALKEPQGIDGATERPASPGGSDGPAEPRPSLSSFWSK